MKTLREAVGEAREKKIALGHFNVSDSNQFNAIIAAAQEAQLPVLVGASEGEREFFGVKNLATLVAAARAQGMPVYLNADHTYSIEKVKEAIDAGFDSVIFDGSHLPMEENIAKTREAVAYARASGRDVLIEGEIGKIGQSSKILDAVPDDVDKDLTKPEDAAHFVHESGADMLAPAVGTLHGILRSGASPKIDTARIAEIAAATGIPLVLHGGSGSTDADFVASARAGMAIIHINTDIRIAYRKGIEAGLAKNADEIAPYRFLAPGVEGVKTMTRRYLELFAHIDTPVA